MVKDSHDSTMQNVKSYTLLHSIQSTEKKEILSVMDADIYLKNGGGRSFVNLIREVMDQCICL